MTQTLIAGEDVNVLAQALRQFEITTLDDGMVHVNVDLDSEVGVPFHHALLHVEADLLLQEAEQLTTDGPFENRTDDQRRCDALNELIGRFADAVRVSERRAED